ncbi:MAG: hypothetical protein LBT66_03270 [Methanobrevibacter sp.]|nr:hypothetical protein [Candidatus Methanovirga meridionalis]
MDNAENIDEELRKREIKRLISPLNYPKGISGFFRLGIPTDIEGNPVPKRSNGRIFSAALGVSNRSSRKYTLEPKIGILTDDEILKYAGESNAASRIRLKRGIGSSSDKTNLYGDDLFCIWIFIGFMASLLVGMPVAILNPILGVFVLLFTIGIPTIYTFYIYHLKNYIEIENVEQTNLKMKKKKIEEDNLEHEPIKTDLFQSTSSFKTYGKQISELKNLYQAKEKIALELIEKHFTPPQITYDRFIGVIDNCNQIFYKQADLVLNIINVATKHTPKIDEELEKRLSTLKSLIEKVDDLTMELVINLNNHGKDYYLDESKELLDEMQILIDSVKEYDY